MRIGALVLTALWLAGCGAEPNQPGTTRDRARPPAFSPVPVATAQVGAEPSRRRADLPAGRWLTATLRRATALRTSPDGRTLDRLRTRTEFGSRRVLGVVRRRPGWLQVVATERSNGAHGWIRASDARLGATDWSLHVDRSARRLVLRRDGHRVRSLPVAVGRPGTPTPLGRFAVTDKLRPERQDSPYGCCIIALSGHQTRLVEGWPGGDRLAIHATPQPETVGRPVSLGCMRAHSGDVRRLMRTVPLGTPVFVRA